MATGMETTSGQEGTLSTWAGPYITDMLGKAEALAGLPFQKYGGALTAGASDLQNKAFQGIGGLTVPTAITQAGQTLGNIAGQTQPAYQAGTFDAMQFNQPNVQQYMNPYLQSVLDPQLREAQRQADIARNAMQGRMAQAGAYGGSRQAIMEAEANRNLMTQLSDITGKGYATAFEDAARRLGEQNARNLEAAKFGEQSRQFGTTSGLEALGRQIQAAQAQGQAGALEAQYGLQNLDAMLKAGATERDIEQQGLTADYNQYLRQFEYPRQMLEFQRNMISGIPGIASSSFYQPAPSAFSSAAGGALTAMQLLEMLKQFKD